MNVDFMLVASAGPNMPVINHAAYATNETDARFECQRYIVPALSKAGYTSFTLYNTSRKNSLCADIEICRFRVAHQEPHILMD